MIRKLTLINCIIKIDSDNKNDPTCVCMFKKVNTKIVFLVR